MLRVHRFTSITLAAAAALASLPAGAQDAVAPETIVITGSVGERVVADAPYAITVVGRDELRDAGPLINLSEGLARVPGLVVANRSNYAQDLQISSRGFGARATFGVRGLRLYADGIPASGPDGQGQVSQFDLAGAQRVEVLRGPFSVLYGNSSGGVISIFSAPIARAEAEGELDVGSFGLRQLRAAVQAPFGGGFDGRISASTMETDGFRPHSSARRTSATARLGWRGANDTVVVSASHLDQPADDPLGLTRAEFDADPRQTTPNATIYDTRKDLSHDQVGASWKHRFDGGALRETSLMAYGGRRSVAQWLAIPAATQAAPRHGGGVIDFDRSFYGAEARARWGWDGLDVQAGLAYDDQSDDRQGYLNYTGDPAAPVYGGRGALRRDEVNGARSADAFAQAEWAFAADWAASFGVRSGQLKQTAEDHYLSNGDDSGEQSFRYTNPVVGLRWEPVKGLHLHASLARGFEAPTLNETAYRVDGTSGLNSELKPQKSRQAEIGAKWRPGGRDGGPDLDFALFHTTVSDEIGVATNTGGRSSFQNVGRTRRYGAELGTGWKFAPAWSARAALTWLNATYRDSFQTCVGTPCIPATATNVGTAAAGNTIAGTQKASGYAELAWAGGAWGTWAVEARGGSKMAANDVNSDFAAGWGTAALRWSHAFELGAVRMEVLARVDNLFDKTYAGSVIVNEGNQRYFETGAPRNFLLALRVNGGL